MAASFFSTPTPLRNFIDEEPLGMRASCPPLSVPSHFATSANDDYAFLHKSSILRIIRVRNPCPVATFEAISTSRSCKEYNGQDLFFYSPFLAPSLVLSRFGEPVQPYRMVGQAWRGVEPRRMSKGIGNSLPSYREGSSDDLPYSALPAGVAVEGVLMFGAASLHGAFAFDTQVHPLAECDPSA